MTCSKKLFFLNKILIFFQKYTLILNIIKIFYFHNNMFEYKIFSNIPIQ